MEVNKTTVTAITFSITVDGWVSVTVRYNKQASALGIRMTIQDNIGRAGYNENEHQTKRWA
jgi:hypothetical protein